MDSGKVSELSKKIYEKHKVEWPNVFVPDGWTGVLHAFNAKGYGKILVDPKGIVRGADLHAAGVEALLKKIYP
jgi:hypothetical protein